MGEQRIGINATIAMSAGTGVKAWRAMRLAWLSSCSQALWRWASAELCSSVLSREKSKAALHGARCLPAATSAAFTPAGGLRGQRSGCG